MTAKHTQGPWVAIPMPDGSIDICKSNAGYHIAQMLYTGYPADVQANARLIASAPDLLASLESLLDDADVCEVAGDDAIRQARAAIAKAKGE
jgi:hypothetical protein